MKVVQYQASNQSVRHGLFVTEGRKWSQLILVEHPIRLIKVPNSEQRNMADMDYKVSKAKRIIKQMVKVYYGTIRNAPKNVRAVLK
jgi:hypothetical protein